VALSQELANRKLKVKKWGDDIRAQMLIAAQRLYSNEQGSLHVECNGDHAFFKYDRKSGTSSFYTGRDAFNFVWNDFFLENNFFLCLTDKPFSDSPASVAIAKVQSKIRISAATVIEDTDFLLLGFESENAERVFTSDVAGPCFQRFLSGGVNRLN
jgi:hypothetical protein